MATRSKVGISGTNFMPGKPKATRQGSSKNTKYAARKSIVVKEDRVKTTPKLVEESNTGLFHAKMNLPEAAKHCGMTEKEMKMTFWEYLKYNPPVEPINKQEH